MLRLLSVTPASLSFGQPVLQRLERPLGRPEPGANRREYARFELLERPSDLGWMTPIDLAASFRGVKIMRPAIGVEADRQAVLGEHLVQRSEGRGRALLLDQKRRIDCPRRVIHGHNQIERSLAFEPCVPRAVLVQHHPRQRPPLRLRRCAPLRGAFGTTPAHCRCELERGLANGLEMQ